MKLHRRRFLYLAGSSLLLSAACAHWKRSRVEKFIVINSLGELSDPNTSDLDAGPKISDRVIDDALASGMTAVNITLGYVSGSGDPFEITLSDIDWWDDIVAQFPERLIKVLTTGDVLRTKREERLGVIYGFQNAAMMGEDSSRVDLFADKGVRVIQLTYNLENQLGGGALAPENTPLTTFGREIVDRLNARGVIVDLAHSGRQTCLDAARHSTAPIAISHTGCRSLVDLPRNKTDEELRLVAEKGGYVGIYFMPFLADGRQITSDDVVAHIEHAINVCGEDCVGIGTDGGTTAIDDMGSWKKAFAAQIERRRAAGISAPGERPDSFIFAIDMNGPEQFQILADKLAARGYSESRIEKVLGANFLRFARDVWDA